MPRRIDHEGRRVRIAEAVCLLADEHGLEGVRLRDVAARAEVSMGAVQRCFRTKEEMLVFALSHVSARVTERIGARDEAAPGGESARDALTRITGEVALVAEERQREARVWLAFVAQAAVTPSLAEVVRESYAELHPLLVRLVREAAEGSSEASAEREARALLALTDGLTTHVLIGHLSPADALGVLEGHLDRLCGERRDA
ncbi:TetR family transcriptional regulator C-terminal domain-containing protein [Streptomyces sp. ODS28]|uniref:TetR/AcrR family transcriptional regulator n=1 Tax=Streptomyces sp. ODS28 TaxID=3136688 RepID=UPI0031E7B6A1